MQSESGMNKKESEPADFNRRDFLRGGSATLMTLLGGVPLFAQSTTNAPAESKPAGPKIKVAVIGLGLWGREILSTLGRLPQAEVAAVCDTYAASLRRAGNAAPGATQTADYKTILDNKDIKAVVIATPTHQHKDIAVAALKAGKHVYCEAPLANTMEDAREIAKSAKSFPKQIFQAGFQLRADPERNYVFPFLRSGAIGKAVLARAQWHKKESWRAASANPEHEKELNWRLSKETSIGLAGEIGAHQIDQTSWYLSAQPVSAIGFGTIALWKDGRDVPDTVQAVIEYPDNVRLMYDATLADSFEAEYEVYYGTFAAIMVREDRAWIFKEVDSPMLGWEVYGKKEAFHAETGYVLTADATKTTSLGTGSTDTAPTNTPLFYSLQTFLANSNDLTAAIEDFIASYGADDPNALVEQISKMPRKAAAGYLEGFRATVTAIKVNEAIVTGQRIVFKPEWFELS